MSNEKNENKNVKNEKLHETDTQKSSRIEKAQNKSTFIKEGYQPTDTLNTNNPPKGNESSSDSSSSNKSEK